MENVWFVHTAALAPQYSGNEPFGCIDTILDVAIMKPPGIGFCLMKWIESWVPYTVALKQTSVVLRLGSGGTLAPFS